jgi:DNA-binding CsgD family transcriptional regulator/PAS domain-containing protein
MPSGRHTLFETVECIYATVTAPALWSDALAMISNACGSDVAVLFQQGLSTPGATVIASSNISPEITSNYVSNYSAKSPFFSETAQLHVTDGVMLSHEIVGDCDLMRTEFFNEFLKPQNLFYGAAGIVALDSPHSVTVLLTARSKRRKSFRPDERRTLRQLSRVVGRVIQLQSRLDAVSGALDCLSEGVFLTDDRGVIIHANSIGRTMLAECRLVSEEAYRLSTQGPYVSRFPLHHSPGYAGATQVVLVSPIVKDRGRFALFGWTPAETRVATLISEGLTVREVALQARLSEHTVRNQLKQAMHKSGSRRQADLVARMCQCPK